MIPKKYQSILEEKEIDYGEIISSDSSGSKSFVLIRENDVIKIIHSYPEYVVFLSTTNNPFAPKTEILYHDYDLLIVRQEKVIVDRTAHYSMFIDQKLPGYDIEYDDLIYAADFFDQEGNSVLGDFLEELAEYIQESNLFCVNDFIPANCGFDSNGQMKLFDSFVLIEEEE